MPILCQLFNLSQIFSFLYSSRQDDQRAGGDTNPPGDQSHTGDCPPAGQEGHQQQQLPRPSTVTEENKETKETETEEDGSQLSSSVIVDMSNLQPGLELSTITGAEGAVVKM